MLSPMKKLKLFQLATKYGIRIREYDSGYVQVHVANWSKHAQQFMQIIEKLERYPEVKSIIVSKETSTISVYYDETMFDDEASVDYWFNELENHILR